MKHILPHRNDRQSPSRSSTRAGSLALLAALLAGISASPCWGQSTGPQPIPIAEPGAISHPPAAAPPVAAGPDGQAIVRQAAGSMAKIPALSARIRQKIDLHGAQLAGTGSYLQLGTGDDMLLRLAVKVQVEKHVTSLQQVCDGRFLWLRRDMPDGTSLQRIDLKQVRETYRGSSAAGDGPWLAIGGLPRLLEGLVAKYEFAPPQGVKIGDIPAWKLVGDWRKSPSAKGPPGDLVPKRAALVIGQDDYFPYRIEFQRHEKKPGDDEPTWHTVMSLELYDVEIGAAIDPLQFVYKPDNQTVTDATDAYLRKLGGRPVEQARKPSQPR